MIPAWVKQAGGIADDDLRPDAERSGLYGNERPALTAGDDREDD